MAFFKNLLPFLRNSIFKYYSEISYQCQRRKQNIECSEPASTGNSKGGDFMFFNRFFFHNRRCSRYRCCSCHNRQCSNASTVYTVYDVRHYADIPMRIYYGPGYTQQNVLESMDASLEIIAHAAQSLQTVNPHNGCGCCC